MKHLFSIAPTISLFLLTTCEKTPEAPPVASFTVSTDVARPGEAILFQNTSTGGKTFIWDFGDGSNSGEENPSHVYSETGEYVAHLVVSNPGGSDEAGKGILISLWSTGTPMPTGRWLLNTSVVDGKIYAIGGGSKFGEGALGTVEAYDQATDTWSARSGMPTPRQKPASCVVDGKIYVLGGCEFHFVSGYDYNVECYTTVEEYDPATDTWSEKSPMPTARSFHSACAVDNRIYIIGGGGSGTYGSWNNSVNEMEMYEPATDTWTGIGIAPRPMMNSGCSVIDGKIYIMGGELEGYDHRVDVYDPETDTWTRKADMLTGKSEFGCCVFNEMIYVMGGDGGHEELNSDFLDIYDPANDTWTAGESMFVPRWGLSSSTLEGRIYAIGGLFNFYSPGSISVQVYYE